MMIKLKRTAILSGLLTMSLVAAARDITVKATDRPAAEVFRSIMQQTDRNFVYSSDLLKDMRITVDVNKRPLKRVLDEIFRDTDIEYKIKGKNVVLKKKKAEKPKKTKSLQKGTAPNLYITDTIKIAMLPAVDVISQSENHPLETAKLGISTLSGAVIAKTPSFLGEKDVVKALQILPGVSEATEGMAGMNVHGGSADENMVMLDNVPFYQAEHFAGLFSPFNADIVRSADFYKTSIPARFDGRLSSFLDVHLKNGSTQGHHGSAKLGLTSGAFDISGPIGSRTTYLIGLRRSWFDILSIPMLAIVNAQKDIDEQIRFNYHFTDFNARLTHRFSDRVEGFVNLYYGDDMLKTGTKDKNIPEQLYWSDLKYDFNWGNILAQSGIDWRISPTLYSQFSAAYTRFFNKIKKDEIEKTFSEGTTTTGKKFAKTENVIDNVTLRGDFTLRPQESNTFRFGAAYTWNSFLPDRAYRETTINDLTSTDSNATKGMIANQAEAYVEDNWNISERLHAEAGLHASLFYIDAKTKWGLSPRLAFSFKPNSDLSLKAAYSRTVQYAHRIDETYLSLPCDRWVPTADGMKPMTADKISIGGYWQLHGGDYAVSLEGYWKSMHNILDYRDEYYITPAKWSWSKRLTSGKGRAKGIDLMVEKKTGKLTGHVSYSLAWADRQFADKNGGHRFPARFDHRHTIKIFLNWDISRKVSISALWTGHSGNRFTFLPQRFENPVLPGAMDYYGTSWDGQPLEDTAFGKSPLRTSVNNYQLPFYHRLDLSCMVRNKRGYWTFGLYNAYCNMNTIAITYGYSDDYISSSESNWGIVLNSKPAFRELKLLPIIPSISYTWQF
ncbi:MAG: TonB-dependent receptor [Muribaculaceae bacterium]|nr:TonB-dependent receptor [Muribaculaceae bacterium]